MKNKHIAHHLPRRTKGLTLIEVLVTIIILAIGLLGMAALQMNSLRNNTTAYERTQATLLAHDIIDRIRANGANAASYGVVLGVAPSGVNCTGTGANCSPAQMAAYDIDAWKCSLGLWDANASCGALGMSGLLPQGDGSVVVNGTLITVTIQWEEKRDATGAARTTSLTINSQV